MARTFNRRPMSVSGPDKNDIKNYTFNYEQWKGINDSKDFLAVDQMTFSDSQNMYIDSEGLLSSRPGLKADTTIHWNSVKEYYEFKNDVKDSTIKVYGLYLVISDTIDIVDSAATAKVSIALTPSDAPLKYIDSYDKLYLFKGDNQMVVYDKSLLRFLTAEEVSKLIYVPVTKTFTGSTENDGEGVNKLTTAERYLYYYSDVNGINSDAIGKTLEWDGKTISWSDNVKPFLVKDHYDFGNSTVIAVAASGAVAWVENNVLYYAVNGAIVYSWDLSNLVTASAMPNTVKFNPGSNTILVRIGYKMYVVSCVSTKEDGSLAIKQPTLITELTGFSKYNDFQVYTAYYIDELQYVYTVRDPDADLSTTSICYNFGEADTRYEKDISHDSSGTNLHVNADGAVMNADSIVVTYNSIESDGNKRNFIIIHKSAPTVIDRKDIFAMTDDMAYHGVLQMTIDSYVAYIPKIGTADASGTYKIAGIYCFKNPIYGTDAAVTKNGAGLYTLTPEVTNAYLKPVYDNANIVSLNDVLYDFSKTDYSTTTSPVVSTKTADGTLLESTTNVYNYYKTVNGSNHIFTRFNDDTFELYYNKQGTVQNLNVYDVLYLNSYFFAVGNKLYITENRYDDDGEFLFYLPEKNTNEFDNIITKLHQINETTIAVFFEDEIYYTVYDSDVSTYRYYKSKLQYGLRKGANVITSDDSVTTYFPTDRGIMALTYQNFIASSEQATTPISDSVFNYTKDFLKGKVVKLYKKDFWIAAYNGSKTVWLLDIRNGSWWRQELPIEVLAIWSKNNSPLIKQVAYTGDANAHTAFTLGNTEYTDDGTRIQWFFQSQKLHLSALNYYKSVQALTFFGVSDEDSCLFNLDTYAYRDTIYENATKNVEYGINLIRTYLYRLHIMKLHEFQFKVYSDDTIQDTDLIKPIKLSNVSVRYRVSREVR